MMKNTLTGILPLHFSMDGLNFLGKLFLVLVILGYIGYFVNKRYIDPWFARRRKKHDREAGLGRDKQV